MAKSVRETAMDMLARREHTRLEVEQKLAKKDFSVEEIEQALNKLVSENLLSDERFTEAFIHSRMQRGSGPVKIRAELRQKGVTDAMIAEFLDPPDSQWLEHAQEARIKRFGSLLPEEYNNKVKQMRFLQQRGFTTEQVRHSLRDDDIYCD